MSQGTRLRLACVALALAACSTRAPTVSRSAASLPVGAMSKGRAVPIAVTLQDGRVLVPGGSNAGASLAACDVYAPDAESWSTTASMSTAREYHTATVLADGRVLVTGGMAPYTATASTEVYDPVAGAWTPAAPMTSARLQHGAVRLADGRVLVSGGKGPSGSLLVSGELYDPVTDSWSPTSPPLATANVLVLLGDGRVLATAYGAGVQLYDPVADVWSDAGPAPAPGVPPDPFSRVLVPLNDGRVLFVPDGTASWIWDPLTGQWSAAAARGTPHYQPGLALLDDGTVLVGGSSSAAAATSVERYDPAANAWLPQDPLLTPRASPALVAVPGGRALVLGGRDPTTGTWPSLATAELVGGGGGCTPAPDPCASGSRCGTVSDGCGGTVACGGCSAGFSCSDAHSCVPACVPTTCAQQGKDCGQIPDGCGLTLSCGSCQPGWACAANVCTASAGVPVRDPALGAPRCTVAGPVCDSGTLLVGRGPLGPEVNAPNTLRGSCADGASGAFHRDESLDALRISSVDGAPLTAGKVARIDATVWAYSIADRLDLYAAPDASAPVWTFIATLVPASSGLQTLSANVTLPRGALQAIRGTFRYSTTAGACTSGGYDDHDDLAFPVVVPADTAPPVVNLASPAAGARVAGTVTVSAIAADDVGIARVEFLVDGAVAFADSTAPYAWGWDSRAKPNGWHAVGARAWDLAGNVAEEPPVSVYVDNDLVPPVVALTSPAAGASVTGTVLVQATASDDVALASVEFQVDGVSLGRDLSWPFEASWSTDTWSTGPHTIVATARDLAGNAATATRTVTVTRTGGGGAAYTSTLGAPACTGAVASCDTVALVDGRGPREPNQPNTIDTCTDGTAGVYHSDESLDRLRVSTLDGGPLAAQKTVRVEATVWAWGSGTSDTLDVWVADLGGGLPAWRFAGTARPGSGLRTLAVDVKLSSAPRQAIRGVFRYGGAQLPCPGGSFDDVDDLAFDVQP